MQKDTLLPIAALILGLIAGYLFATQTLPRTAPITTQHDAEMKNAMHQMTSGLEGKTGEDFERAFLEEMTTHHVGAIQMAQALLANTSRPELKKLAEDIISAQTAEINMMHDWSHAWFGGHN